MRVNYLYISIAGFAIGILFRSFFLFAFSFSLFFLYRVYYRKLFSAEIIIIALFILSFALGILRFDIANLNKGNPALDAIVGQEIDAYGIVADEPDERE